LVDAANEIADRAVGLEGRFGVEAHIAALATIAEAVNMAVRSVVLLGVTPPPPGEAAPEARGEETRRVDPF
jgi:hypothetical protein